MQFLRRHARIISAIVLSELDLTLALCGALLTLLPIGRSERAKQRFRRSDQAWRL